MSVIGVGDYVVADIGPPHYGRVTAISTDDRDKSTVVLDHVHEFPRDLIRKLEEPVFTRGMRVAWFNLAGGGTGVVLGDNGVMVLVVVDEDEGQAPKSMWCHHQGVYPLPEEEIIEARP